MCKMAYGWNNEYRYLNGWLIDWVDILVYYANFNQVAVMPKLVSAVSERRCEIPIDSF